LFIPIKTLTIRVFKRVGIWHQFPIFSIFKHQRSLSFIHIKGALTMNTEKKEISSITRKLSEPSLMEEGVLFNADDEGTYPPEFTFVVINLLPGIPVYFDRTQKTWWTAIAEKGAKDIYSRDALYHDDGNEDIYWQPITFRKAETLFLPSLNSEQQQGAMSEFTQGVVYAAGIVVEVHDEPTLAQTILSNANIDREAAKKCVDEHDVKIIDKAKAWPDSK
jgi:hypothetical protein